MSFLRTLSGVNCRKFWYFGKIPLKMKINPAPAGIRTKYFLPRHPLLYIPTTPNELKNLLVLNIKENIKF